MTEPCPACSHPVPAAARFCAACGAAMGMASTPTGTAPRGPAPSARPAGPDGRAAGRPSAPRPATTSGTAPRISSGVASDARFPPGALVGGITLVCEMPIASDLTSWAGLPALASFALVSALAVYGFRTATGGRGLNFGLGD